MKIKSTAAALLCAAAATTPAFAVPLVANTDAPSIIGASQVGESSLQSIADTLFSPGAVNVQTGQSSAGLFASATPSATSLIPTVVAEFTTNASAQSFGIWFGTDTTNIVSYDLLVGGATAGNAVGLTISGNTLEVFGPSGGCGVKFNCGSFTNALINPLAFGFFFKPTANGPTYYSLDQLNSGDRTDRVVAFQNGASTNWLFAYEGGSDFDYNDMAVKVESIVAITAVPEPETYALMLAGLGAVGFMARRRKQA